MVLFLFFCFNLFLVNYLSHNKKNASFLTNFIKPNVLNCYNNLFRCRVRIYYIKITFIN